MEIQPTALPDVWIIVPQLFGDHRGFFMETYHAKRYAEAGIAATFVQDNHSGSRRGILRGLHYQIRHAQGKLVRAVVGSIFDVVVDLRRSSPTFGRWVGMELSAENHRQLWVPPGFAHGFYVLSDWAEVFYKATDFYAPEWERTLLWNDPALQIAWPIPTGEDPVLSEKDRQGKRLQDADCFE
ncbi:MAG TPA: dTDP-4-dehydrorhamnose 3,5-epimerase [Anaerolinea thermolimosa]|uniref:dTDP-4-dehydrorhamnose 3,5-epimerase n=1 Tax=Anaerolinea thermolimosa TaxID=229919 RepID=A0A3D1JI29_9CHLR|nr:dTDP-4-dehydrorhamnose 3,5-epimerase [Anaerolinea thermolimosa]GAP05404.1 dTDP-4-dehydrorhamnose 3,5-epimerase [Anaerolinea thermolimosa]HCE18240.1 dTDP-4-dehydrorhamnose 3,5-epimerase [Anaerolinea thermolimosa]